MANFNLSKGDEKKGRKFNLSKETDLQALKKSILADGVIDEAEVKQLREVLYSDGKIDKKEADFLFELNDAVSGKANHQSWETLFVEAISSFLLEDEQSPGEIDADEAKWLLSKIQGDGRLDKTEKALLDNIKNKAKDIPPVLKPLFSETKKSKWWLWLLLAIIAIALILFFAKKCSSDGGINKFVSDKTEQVTAKVGEITAELQNPDVNFEEAQAKVEEAQKAVDEAKSKATSDEEQKAVAEAQAKVDEVAKAVETAKKASESTQPAADETATPASEGQTTPAESEQPAATTPAAEQAKPAQATGGQQATTPAQNAVNSNQSGQATTAKPATKPDAKSPSSNIPQGTLEEKAKRVIRGDFGNGAERKQALGNEYREIQSKVNEMYRNGLVY